MKFKTKEDWQKYLKENLSNQDGYAVVKYENTITHNILHKEINKHQF